jgi:hypothetical protein
MQSVAYSCHVVMKFEFFLQIFEKHTNIKFIGKTRPVGAELFHADGQTDIQT